MNFPKKPRALGFTTDGFELSSQEPDPLGVKKFETGLVKNSLGFDEQMGKFKRNFSKQFSDDPLGIERFQGKFWKQFE